MSNIKNNSIEFFNKNIKEVTEENNIILEQLQNIQNKIIDCNNILNNNIISKKNLLFNNLYELSIEYLNLYVLENKQRLVIQVEQKNSLISRLSYILIKGCASWKSLIILPYRLFTFWRTMNRNEPPSLLGGKNFQKVIDIYTKDGIQSVEKLLNSYNISFEIKANAYTALARHFMEINEQQAAFFAYHAWEIDPRPFRLKWLAFRIHEANDPITAEALINILPKEIHMNDSEKRHVERIRSESKLQKEKHIQFFIEKYLTEYQQSNNYFKYLKQYAEECSILHNITIKQNYNHNNTKIENTHIQKINFNPNQKINNSNNINDINNINIYIKQHLTNNTLNIPAIKENEFLNRNILNPKISIIIPVYNKYNYIKKCLDSVICQTLKDIEIIVIDDYSDDGTDKIIEDFSNKDKRITFIKYNQRKSQSQARKDGVLLSKAHYIMFLDSDDFLEINACEVAYQEIEKSGCDIVQFETIIHNTGNISLSRINNLEIFLNNYESKQYLHDEIFDRCFNKQNFNFTLWNKIYKSDLCKKAFSLVEDGYYPKAQYLYAYL